MSSKPAWFYIAEFQAKLYFIVKHCLKKKNYLRVDKMTQWILSEAVL